MPWYSTGSVAVAANSATVTGTGTAFSANGRVGDAFRGPDGRWYEITNIASATVLSIKPNYQGATASGQAYAIAPMQGYVKESADRLRQLVDQYGSQLAALQPWATSATPAAARESLGANDAANLTAGLLNVARIPATLTPDKAFRRGNILGTVSQSGGVPTGAIIERGSNANGEYMRFADGTQICWGVVVLTYTSVAYLQTSWSFPAAFTGTASVTGSPYASVLSNPAGNRAQFGANQGSASSTLRLYATGVDQFKPGDSASVTAFAFGRWY